MSNAKCDGLLSPAIGVKKAPVVLITSGYEAVNSWNDRSGIRRHRILLCYGSDQCGSPLKQFDSLLVAPGEVVKSSFDSYCVRCAQRIGVRIEHRQCFADMIQSALISGHYQRGCRQRM